MEPPKVGRLRVVHGVQDGPGIVPTGTPLLDGPEEPFLEFCPTQRIDGWVIGEAEGFRIAVYRGEEDIRLDRWTHRLYHEILDLRADGESLLRVWHFLPRINETIHHDEQYRLFCEGRMNACAERELARYPAASAVGAVGSSMTVVAVLTDHPVALHENPLQVPAYQYPKCYGEKAPGFSRAAQLANNAKCMYVSGTSSIRGHETVCGGDFSGQLAVTLENLETLATGIPGLELGSPEGRMVCYLRHERNLAEARKALHPRFGSSIRFVRADICRSDLLLEIEWEQSTPFRGASDA